MKIAAMGVDVGDDREQFASAIRERGGVTPILEDAAVLAAVRTSRGAREKAVPRGRR